MFNRDKQSIMGRIKYFNRFEVDLPVRCRYFNKTISFEVEKQNNDFYDVRDISIEEATKNISMLVEASDKKYACNVSVVDIFDDELLFVQNGQLLEI